MPLTHEQQMSLGHLTQEKLRKMFEDKKQTPKLLIPKYLPSFTKSGVFIKFLEAVYEYCAGFNDLMIQYAKLKHKMEGRIGEDAILLRKQKQSLAKLEKQVSYCYAAILLNFNNQTLQDSGRRSNFKDQVFFEALIYLVERVIKDLFNRQDFTRVQQQINRIFRTNRYNLIKKRHQNDQILLKFPALKEQSGKNKTNLAQILNKAPERISAYKKFQRQKRHHSMHEDYTKTLGIPKELLSPDMEQRSPLMCTWLPSRKSMLSDFSQISAYIQQNQRKSNSYHTITQSTEKNGVLRSRIAGFGSKLMTNIQG